MNTTAALHTQLNVIAWVAWAMILGAFIGWERAKSAKATGVRTHMLVAGAAALVVAISMEATLHTGVGDPTRGLHAVVTGIGFLGAGAIVQQKRGPVNGLTSAASVFFTAAIGCAVPLGFGITATAATILGFAVLAGVGRLVYRIEHHDDHPHSRSSHSEPKDGNSDDHADHAKK